ncbi:3019_t:CDS:1, partial [Ambispora gerdemannii]
NDALDEIITPGSPSDNPDREIIDPKILEINQQLQNSWKRRNRRID